jgi:hypothetical protein
MRYPCMKIFLRAESSEHLFCYIQVAYGAQNGAHKHFHGALCNQFDPVEKQLVAPSLVLTAS